MSEDGNERCICSMILNIVYLHGLIYGSKWPTHKTVFIYGQQYEYDLSARMDVDLSFKRSASFFSKGTKTHVASF